MKFYKFDGAGNDFVIVDNRKECRQFGEEEVARICHRRFGVGADGFMTLADDAEPAADLRVRASRLHGTVIEGSLIPRLIDELPVIAAMACTAEGTTVIRDARELKVKESDRIRTMAEGLSRMGAAVTETPDGMIIEGGRPLRGAEIDSRGDHRVAMAFTILSLLADGPVTISHPECVSVSAPDFYRDLKIITS